MTGDSDDEHRPRRTSRRRSTSSPIRTSQSSKAANAAALGAQGEAEGAPAPPPSKTSVLVLNGNGVAGSAANAGLPAAAARLRDGAAARERLAERADAGLLPHEDLLRQAEQAGSKAAANALAKLFVPGGRRPAAEGPAAAGARPGRDAHRGRRARRSTTSSWRRRRRPPAPKHAAAERRATTPRPGSTC